MHQVVPQERSGRAVQLQIKVDGVRGRIMMCRHNKPVWFGDIPEPPLLPDARLGNWMLGGFLLIDMQPVSPVLGPYTCFCN